MLAHSVVMCPRECLLQECVFPTEALQAEADRLGVCIACVCAVATEVLGC